MLTLIHKDIKLLFAKDGSNKKKVLSYLASMLLLILFIGIESFLFSTLLNKIQSFNNAPKAFLAIFLGFISIFMIILNTLRAKKLFFNDLDIQQLTQHPLSSGEIIISKLFLLFLMHYFTTIVLVYPLFISYGLLIHKTMWFYYIILFYPVITFLFEGGISLLLVYPYKLLADYLNKHTILQFISSIILMAIFGVIYYVILTLFMQLVGDNNLNLLFTVSNINKVLNISNKLIPINFLIDTFVMGIHASFMPLISIALGVFLIGCAISSICYSYFRNYTINENNKKKHNIKVLSVEKQLLKKEFLLLFKDENYIFSFTGLLFIQPLLMYLVVGSVNTIFNSGTYLYYMKILPAFLPLLDILIILLFTVLISSGANQYIRMEQKTMKIIKTIPVSFKKQLSIKVIIPFAFSLCSLLISLMVLLLTKTIRFDTFLFSLILSIILLMTFDEVSLIKELSLHQKSILNEFVSYVLPILLFIISVIISYYKINIYFIYSINIITYLIISIVLFIYLHKNLNDKFMELEVIN